MSGEAGRLLAAFKQKLIADADSEERLLLPQWYRDPVDLAAHEVLGAVCAHRTAEEDRPGVTGHGVGQRITEARLADVERIAALP